MKIFFGRYIIEGREEGSVYRVCIMDTQTEEIVFDETRNDMEILKKEAIDFCSERIWQNYPERLDLLSNYDKFR